MGAAFFPILGGVVGAASSIMQGQQQAAAYKAQARVAENNARMAQEQGSEAARQGAREEKQLRRQGAQFAGSQLATLAASGGQIGGSSLGVLADTAMGIEEDAQTIRFNTMKNKWGFDVQAVNYQNEANAARSSAKNARTAGYVGAFSTLLGTAAQVWPTSGSSTGSKLKNGQITVGGMDDYYKRQWRYKDEQQYGVKGW